MVVTSGKRLDALRGLGSVGRVGVGVPGVSVGSAVLGIVGDPSFGVDLGGHGGGGDSALSTGLDVLRLTNNGFASLGSIGQISNIHPGGGAPVGVIVTFLRTLVTTAGTVGVLAGVNGTSVLNASNGVGTVSSATLDVLVSGVEAEVALGHGAQLVIVVRLMTSVLLISVAIVVRAIVVVVRDGVGGGTIAKTSIAHVLPDDVAIVVGLASLGGDTARMLVGPLQGDDRSLVELLTSDGSNVGSTTVVVLGIEQTISVGTITVGFIQSVVGATNVAHVDIGISRAEKKGKRSKYFQHC
jgi:hypothetical protein